MVRDVSCNQSVLTIDVQSLNDCDSQRQQRLTQRMYNAKSDSNDVLSAYSEEGLDRDGCRSLPFEHEQLAQASHSVARQVAAEGALDSLCHLVIS